MDPLKDRVCVLFSIEHQAMMDLQEYVVELQLDIELTRMFSNLDVCHNGGSVETR